MAKTGPGDQTEALSTVLDRLEGAVEGEDVSVGEIVDALGQRSFAALMLVVALVCASPASAIPGLTAGTGVVVALLAAQMILGRRSVWLPDFVTRRRLPRSTLCKGIGWLRRPVRFVEGFLRERLTWLLHRPWLLAGLVPVMLLALAMPLMEVIPTSGSIAAGVIALFAAGLLARDGGLVALAMALLLGLPVALWWFATRA
jgi:hypothetical protein